MNVAGPGALNEWIQSQSARARSLSLATARVVRVCEPRQESRGVRRESGDGGHRDAKSHPLAPQGEDCGLSTLTPPQHVLLYC